MANRVRQTELDEFSFIGPFGGIQSQCGRAQVEEDGFYDALDVAFMFGGMRPREVPSVLPNPTSTPIQAVFDFFNFQGTRISGVISNGNIYQWIPATSSWSAPIAGPMTDTTDLISWTVVAGKLCFSNGADPVMMWDGTTSTYAVSSVNAVPAGHLGELNTHLIACPTVEAGSFAPQRLRWTGAGDPTDWTSFSSGQTDLFNDLGPINNWKKIYQNGYVFQQWGIVQQIITGNSSQPFDFVPLSSRAKGLYFPWTLSGYGEFAIYVGKDNVYLFNGTSSEPIGEAPLRGRAWIGARNRILSDLSAIAPNTPYGIYMTSSNGREFETYWLFIPGSNTWVFNVKEGNWTRFGFNLSSSITCAGPIYNPITTRIADLVGPISSQNWTFNGLAASASQTDSLCFGTLTGSVLMYDFTIHGDTYSLTTGALNFGQTRYSKEIRRIRFACEVTQACTVVVSATNEEGQNEVKTFSFMPNSVGVSYQVFPFHFSGVFISISMVFSNAAGTHVSEIALGYQIGKEVMTQ